MMFCFSHTINVHAGFVNPQRSLEYTCEDRSTKKWRHEGTILFYLQRLPGTCIKYGIAERSKHYPRNLR